MIVYRCIFVLPDKVHQFRVREADLSWENKRFQLSDILSALQGIYGISNDFNFEDVMTTIITKEEG